MFFRLLLLLTLFLGLVTGPVCHAGNCIVPAAETQCGNCCAKMDGACCAKGGDPAGKMPQVVTVSVDLKQAVVPVLFCLGLEPAFVASSSSSQPRTPARLPVQRRLDVTCIRLI